MIRTLNMIANIDDVFKIDDLPENSATRTLYSSVQSQLYWTLRLFIKRHVFVYTPFDIIMCAEEVINELHKATMQRRLATPFDLHSLAIATMTLLEAAVLPEFANDCWASLDKLEEILNQREKNSAEAGEFEDIFGFPGWDAKFRVFLEWRRAKHQESQLQDSLSGANKSGSSVPPPMGPNEQRSLQHLADLAVAADGSVGQNASGSPPPGLSADHEETSPNLAPQLAQAQVQGPITVDFTMLTKEGYLNVFSGLIYNRRR